MTFDSFVKRYIGKAVDTTALRECNVSTLLSFIFIMFSAYVQVRGEMQEIIGLIFHHIQL